MLHMAHYNAALQNQGNISTVAAMTAYQGSQNPYQSIAAGILSMGGRHAPIDAARSLVRQYSQNKDNAIRSIEFLLKKGIKVPGFGNSFFKKEIDPSFKPAYDKYLEITGLNNPVEGISEYLNKYQFERGKNFLFPNAAIITAAIAEEANLPNGEEIAIALQGRMSAWILLMPKYK